MKTETKQNLIGIIVLIVVVLIIFAMGFFVGQATAGETTKDTVNVGEYSEGTGFWFHPNYGSKDYNFDENNALGVYPYEYNFTNMSYSETSTSVESESTEVMTSPHLEDSAVISVEEAAAILKDPLKIVESRDCKLLGNQKTTYLFDNQSMRTQTIAYSRLKALGVVRDWENTVNSKFAMGCLQVRPATLLDSLEFRYGKGLNEVEHLARYNPYYRANSGEVLLLVLEYKVNLIGKSLDEIKLTLDNLASSYVTGVNALKQGFVSKDYLQRLVANGLDSSHLKKKVAAL